MPAPVTRITQFCSQRLRASAGVPVFFRAEARRCRGGGLRFAVGGGDYRIISISSCKDGIGINLSLAVSDFGDYSFSNYTPWFFNTKCTKDTKKLSFSGSAAPFFVLFVVE